MKHQGLPGAVETIQRDIKRVVHHDNAIKVAGGPRGHATLNAKKQRAALCWGRRIVATGCLPIQMRPPECLSRTPKALKAAGFTDAPSIYLAGG